MLGYIIREKIFFCGKMVRFPILNVDIYQLFFTFGPLAGNPFWQKNGCEKATISERKSG
jgi:hypothetical protein